MPSTLTPAADFFAPPAPPSPPTAASLDLDAGAVIRLTRRPDDGGYELMAFTATPPASAHPIPEPPAKPDEPTLTPVQRGGVLNVPAVRLATRMPASLRRALPRSRSRR